MQRDKKYSPIFERVAFCSVKPPCDLPTFLLGSWYLSLYSSFFEHKVFIFRHLLLYFLAQQEWKLRAAHNTEFLFLLFNSLPHRLSVSWKYGLSMQFLIQPGLWCFPPADQSRPEVDPINNDKPSSRGSNWGRLDLASQFLPVTWENSASANFCFLKICSFKHFIFAWPFWNLYASRRPYFVLHDSRIFPTPFFL